MGSARRRAWSLLLALVGLAPTLSAGDVVTRVLCATGPQGAQAWIGAAEGLVLVRDAAPDAAALSLGHGAWPRFAPDGRLVFEVSEDDGHHLTATGLWVLDPGASTPRPPHPGEDLPSWVTPPTAGADPGGPTRLAIDAGHGGSDGGATGNGLLEKDVTLDVALRFADLALADTADGSGGGSWDVLLTRDSDAFVSLAQRATMANAFGADSFCSIHANAFGDPSANGTETYAFAEGTTAAALRDRVQAEMLAAWGLTDRGTKTAGFYVLVNTSMPAELSEMGFITNPGDALLLGSPAARQDMALAHLFAVQAHHGYGVHEPGDTDGTLRGILYDAILGVGAPLVGGTVSLADGSFSTTSSSGQFSFELSAGTYTFAASAPGYAAASASETVSVGDVWESVGLVPAPGPALALAAVGADLDVDVSGGDPFGTCWIAWNLTPGLPLVGLGPKGTLWPAAAGLQLLFAGTLNGSGALHLDATLPPGSGLAVHAQAFTPADGIGRLGNGAAFTLP
jgi:N-acetylmuramoyl-L-alanine amidase